MLPNKIAFVDIETTGTSIYGDRIIEIGILRVENNKLVDTFQTLINPQSYVSPFIEDMTGIRKEELERAPTFNSLKRDILEYLSDCYFVAHNVRFDYGFLKNEYKREEITFDPKHFCTVKLSRHLYPHYKKHDLSSIIERFQFDCKNRHRAFDDAKVLWDFYQKICTEFTQEKLVEAIAAITKKPSLPMNIQASVLEKIPESPGVYMFFNKDKTPLYIGKSKNVKNRISTHFSSDHMSSRQMNMCQQIENIKVTKTCGELGALLRESQLIKKHQPIYNRMLRLQRKLIILKRGISKEGYESVIEESKEKIHPEESETILGVFRSKKQAKSFLINLCKQYSLCERLLGIEKTNAACFAYRLGQCKGACLGKERTIFYNTRFVQAFSAYKIKAWPFKGPIAIEEKSKESSKKELFFIDKWCFLGSILYNEFGEEDFIQEDMAFDLDTYKILVGFLTNPDNYPSIKTGSNVPLENRFFSFS